MPDLPVTLSRGAFASLKAEALLMLLLGCTIKPLQATRMVAKADADVRIVISSTIYAIVTDINIRQPPAVAVHCSFLEHIIVSDYCNDVFLFITYA